MFRRNIRNPGGPAEDDAIPLCLYDLEMAFDFRTFHTEKLETITAGVLTPKSVVKKLSNPSVSVEVYDGIHPLQCCLRTTFYTGGPGRASISMGSPSALLPSIGWIFSQLTGRELD